jgi:hypothetical protein
MTQVAQEEAAQRHRCEQLERWNALRPGAVFESTLSTQYIVADRQGDHVTVISLLPDNVLRITVGDTNLTRQQISFGELDIVKIVYPGLTPDAYSRWMTSRQPGEQVSSDFNELLATPLSPDEVESLRLSDS